MLITCGRKEQDFDGGCSYVVVVVVAAGLRAAAVVAVLTRRGGRAGHRAAAGDAGRCARTRRGPLLTHLVDDGLQLGNGRQPA